MFGGVQGRKAIFLTSRLTNQGRLPIITIMNANLSKQGVATVILFHFIFFLFGGCTIEDPSKSKVQEKNETTGAPLPPKPPSVSSVLRNQNPNAIDINAIDKLMYENLRAFGVEYSKMIPQPDKVDYERVKFLFEQSLLEKEKATPEYKYQFLCDEQEKLIYRCNKVTGEIECYSNRNDKLKILSSVK